MGVCACEGGGFTLYRERSGEEGVGERRLGDYTFEKKGAKVKLSGHDHCTRHTSLDLTLESTWMLRTLY